MRNAIEDVRAFRFACELPIITKPGAPSIERVALCMDMLDEEVNRELLPAMLANDMPVIADGIGDAIYNLIGIAFEYGIPLEAVWKAIQHANMAKVDPETGAVRKRADGKVLKPPGWVAPDIGAVLAAWDVAAPEAATIAYQTHPGNLGKRWDAT